MRALAFLLWALTVVGLAQQIRYSYDKSGRVTRVDYGGGKSISYTYDANDRRRIWRRPRHRAGDQHLAYSTHRAQRHPCGGGAVPLASS